MSWSWRETHHAYYGAALVLFGALLGGGWGWACAGVGLVLVVDDLAQHFLGLDPSPIHLAYERWLYPLPVVQRLNRWVDRLFE